MNLLPIISLLLFFGSSTLVDPPFPPNTASGGTVVAELHMTAGNVDHVDILSGEEPFIGSCKSALSQWHLHPERDGNELVVVHFRQPNLYYLGNAEEEISCTKPKGPLACPKHIVAPAYPAQALGQGSVVLKARISAEGGVSAVQVVKSMGILTDVSIDAVRKWEFDPAEDDQGTAKPSSAYAVLVYRLLITEPEK
jgi:TonB family protein